MSSGDDASSDEPSTATGTGPTEPTTASESLLLTYAAPFLGVLLIAIGLPLSIVGGYVVIQDSAGLCGEPTIAVTPDDEYSGATDTIETLPAGELTTAEQRALEEAIDSPLQEAKVQGDLQNREAFLEGVIVEYEGDGYYVQITSQNSCLEVQPLLFPIGGIAILVGVLGVLTPPIYRKMAGFEERMQRDRAE
ncbi:hypothetical protein [Natrialba asiatica]|uniref:DUF7979 domain-containing protein n=1 Tax=Natrialba asiatica (strain ATCC 700177 / DSM 12278 / JCM 9576 / FERM P-10747 / NBRC 102637 / 172P1) TaxID=29540 RepID=M0AWT4_NATA1|nr:hypothetical protein [Natrialba asiatica]ELZ01874.1 hypothetical protein C481_10147 [Natrialba asiatica DSM 12278]